MLQPLNRIHHRRRLSYYKKGVLSTSKDDRAMRPIYECPEKFRQSLPTPTESFPEIVNELLL